MNEIWKTVTVNEDYEVSNLGNIRSNKRGKSRLLKPFKRGNKKESDGKGAYLSVRLLRNGEGSDYAVHRLVAMAFIPNPNNLHMVNHKNGVRNDNRVENLEWCDNSYNIWHSYNVLGNTNGQENAVVQYTKEGVLVCEYGSIAEAERKTGIDGRSIAGVCKRNPCRVSAGGYVWRYKGDEDTDIEYSKTSPVVQISKYGEKINIFPSVRDASICVNISIGGISGVCLKKQRGYNYAGGYLWRYIEDYDELEFGYFIDKTFIQMTNNNIFVAEYKGTRDLVDNGGFELVKVIMCCRGKRNSTCGFKWCIKEEKDTTRRSHREKTVVQLTKNFEYVAEHKSARHAEKCTKAHATHIGDSCKSKATRTAGGYRWMYKEDYDEYMIKKQKE